MANNHIRAAYANQHGRRDLASVGAGVLPEQVLRCQTKRGGAKLVLQRCQRRKRRGNHDVDGKPREAPPVSPETDEDKRRFAEAEIRRQHRLARRAAILESRAERS